MDDFVSRYVNVEVHPMYDRWGTWADNIMSWVAMRQDSGGFLLPRYEDMVEAPERELAKVASLLNLQVTPERLSKAVELSSADRMRKLEKEQHQLWTQTSATVRTNRLCELRRRALANLTECRGRGRDRGSVGIFDADSGF
jgi:Sulfotransferase domain